MNISIEPAFYYRILTQSPLTELLQGVIGIGIFVVGLGYLRAAVRDPEILRHSDFWKRILLLGCVVIFVTYICAAYVVDLTPTDAGAAAASGEEQGATLFQAKRLILLLLPVDLLGIALMAGMFAALSLQDLQSMLKNAPREDELLPASSFGVFRQLGLLFLLTGTWHVLMVVWWFIFSLHDPGTNWFGVGNGERHIHDIAYHFAFAAAHLAYFHVWKQLEGGRWELRRGHLLEWWGLVTYGGLVLTVYATRLATYVDKIHDRHFSPTAALDSAAGMSLGYLAIPGLACCSALLASVAWRWFTSGERSLV